MHKSAVRRRLTARGAQRLLDCFFFKAAFRAATARWRILFFGETKGLASGCSVRISMRGRARQKPPALRFTQIAGRTQARL